MNNINNILTIDFESWIHTYESSLNSQLRKKKDDGFIYEAGLKLLDLLQTYKATATFFVVGEIFDWYPELIEEIRLRGHEISFHSYSHKLLTDNNIVRDELFLGKKFIDKYRIKGFRAPRLYSKSKYMKYLSKYNFLYDSSSLGNINNIQKQYNVLEIPISSISYRNSKKDTLFYGPLNFRTLLNCFPFGSPYLLSLNRMKTKKIITSQNTKGDPALLCFHIWQIYHPVNAKEFLFYLIGNELYSLPYFFKLYNSFEKLLKEFRFISIKEYLICSLKIVDLY